uniref:Uncharacterized protein n=1 Tax=Oryza nivara TaxID=4536 RepID=A0A0E0G4N3_ORYNI
MVKRTGADLYEVCIDWCCAWRGVACCTARIHPRAGAGHMPLPGVLCVALLVVSARVCCVRPWRGVPMPLHAPRTAASRHGSVEQRQRARGRHPPR